MSTKELVGKAAFVTGAADGIGFAIAEALACAGAQVSLTDINVVGLQVAAARLRQVGADVVAFPCDVAVTKAVDVAVDATARQFGRLDIVVNNAAVAIAGDPAKMTDEEWDCVINTNLTSVFRVIRATLPHLRRAGGGSIINLASTQAHRSWKNWTAYAAAKGGVLAMTRQLAGQLGPEGIRVNSISPGAINTPMNAKRVATEGDQLLRNWTGMHALPRIGETREVAAVAMLLAGDGGAFITGTDIPVDGGLCVLPRYHEELT
jgi:NAD(P)-dependent dehydrogenase (short-subunit alcohol dehydrogenase family)